MPVSSSDTRTRWRKKRKREPQIGRRSKLQKDDGYDDEEEEDEDLKPESESDEDQQQQQNPQLGLDPVPTAEILSDGGVRVSDFPLVVKHTVNRPHPSVLGIVPLERALQCGEGKSLLNGIVLENISHGQLQTLSAVPADSPALMLVCDQERGEWPSSYSSSPAAYVIKPPPITEGRGVVKRVGSSRVHVVPMHADWFSLSTVHRLERQVVPHFFFGKSNDHPQEKYMECRNLIVSVYMENPQKRLSVADCQGLVAGIDSDDLSQIFRFLDHWGIINYCAAVPNHDTRCDESYLREDSNGEVHVPSAVLKSIDSLIQFDRPKCRLKAADVYPLLLSRDGAESDLESRIQEQLSDSRCNYCSCPLTVVYYQSQKEVDTLLCLDCFHNGRFVIGHSSIDFIRVDTAKDCGDIDGERWTNQETLELLEAMEIYNENWNEIAEHVGTKSKAQCILHFIRLPNGEGPLENIEVIRMPPSSKFSNRDDSGRPHSSSNGDAAGFFLQEPDPENGLPFANSCNPVMALVSFLACAVGPRVAAACAHAALAILSEDSQKASGQMEAPGQGNRMNLDRTNTSESSSLGENTNSSQRKEDNSEVHGQLTQNGVPSSLSDEKVRSAAKAGLAAGAIKAKLFADHEEREIQRLSANIINHQLKRLELKLKQFAEVETVLMKECEQVERARQRIAAERTCMISAQMEPAGVTSSLDLPGVGTSMVNTTSNNRQSIITGSPSQPFISGFGSNQQMHPQFMARQQMYGVGPRLPFSSLHPSTSASPNVMFNAVTNPQLSLSHPMLKNISGVSSGLG